MGHFFSDGKSEELPPPLGLFTSSKVTYGRMPVGRVVMQVPEGFQLKSCSHISRLATI